MTDTIRAIYDNGVFRPLQKPKLKLGTEVRLTYEVPPPLSEEDENARREKVRRELDQMWAELDAIPDDFPDDYDLEEALRQNRLWSAGLLPDNSQ